MFYVNHSKMAFGKMYVWSYCVVKMVSFVCVFHLLTTLCLLRVSAQRTQTSIAASFVENPIIEGREAMLHCAVLVPPGEYVIDILYGSKFVVRHDEVQPVTGMDMSLSSDGNTLILKLAQINRTNMGMYTCKVLIPETGVGVGAWRTIGTSSTTLNVHYFSNPPACQLQGMFSGLVLANGDAIRATCSTNPGNPAISIQWTKTLPTGVTFPEYNTRYGMTSYSVYSQLQTNFSSTENNVIYTCTVTSPAFPGATDNTCSIGPFRTLPTDPPTTTRRRIPPQVEHTTFNIPTSDGPEVRIGASPVGTPVIVSIVVVLLIITSSTFLFLLFRFRKLNSQKHFHDTEMGRPFKETAVQQTTKPSSPRPQKSPKARMSGLKKSFTVMAEIIPAAKGKFYPPPPAYPTPTQQQEINQKYLGSSQEENQLEVMSVSSWGDILDSPTGGSHSGDQFASDGDGLVESKKESKTDSLKRMLGGVGVVVGGDVGGGGHYYGNIDIGGSRKQPAVYADVIKSSEKRSNRDSVISQSSVFSDSPLYASIDQSIDTR